VPLSFTSLNHFLLPVALLGGEAAATFFIEFRDELKATHNYLSSIGGKYSQAKISDQNRAS
jgi:hypothetical protein